MREVDPACESWKLVHICLCTWAVTSIHHRLLLFLLLLFSLDIGVGAWAHVIPVPFLCVLSGVAPTTQVDRHLPLATTYVMIRAASTRCLANAARSRAAIVLSKKTMGATTAGTRPLSHSVAAATIAARGDDTGKSSGKNPLWTAGLMALGAIAVSSDQVCDYPAPTPPPR